MQVYTNLSKIYRVWISLFIGVIVGSIGSVVRIGWEVLFPLSLQMPLDSNAEYILQLLCIDVSLLSLKYVFSDGYEWSVVYLVWQFLFSIFFSLFYILFAEFWQKLKFAHGIFYGIMLWLCVYVLFLPLCGFVKIDSMFSYYVCSFIESLLWIWIIELTRRDLRNRITHERDPF